MKELLKAGWEEERHQAVLMRLAFAASGEEFARAFRGADDAPGDDETDTALALFGLRAED